MNDTENCLQRQFLFVRETSPGAPPRANRQVCSGVGHLNFTDYLAKMRIEYACSLLGETELSIQQISERAGYNDYFYFARVFKKETGKTPSAYRSEVCG